MEQLHGWRLLFWLGIALLAHILVALFGVLNRWQVLLQIDPVPPLPALRLGLLVSCLALATVVAVSAAQRAADWALRQRAQRAQRRRGLPRHGGANGGSCGCASQAAADSKWAGAEAAAGGEGSLASKCSTAAGGACDSPASCSDAEAAEPLQAAAEAAAASEGVAAAAAPVAPATSPSIGAASAAAAAEQPGAQCSASQHDAPAAAAAAGGGGPAARFELARQQAASFVRAGSGGGGGSFVVRPGAPPPPRPELALARGMSRRVRALGAGRPRLVRGAALAVITVSFAVAYLCQITAPGFVDPSIVQLINMFTVVGVALVQSLLLRHRLPWVIWPAMAVMLGGACLVIVPAVGHSESGGINGWRGWLGFGLSLGSMISTVVYFVSLQASRRLGFTSLQLQFCYLLFSIALMLPLTLAVDGTDWAAQFDGWRGLDWAVLVLTSSCVCIGANWCIQHATWRIGAPLLSMFYGLRLVAAIVESKIILGSTVITTGLQIAGTVITVSAVTAYMAYTYWSSQRQQAASKAEAAQSEAPPPRLAGEAGGADAC